MLKQSLILSAALVVGCNSFSKKSHSSNNEAPVHTISLGLSSAGTSLVETAQVKEWKLICTEAQFNADTATLKVYGNLNGCAIDLIKFSVGGVDYQKSVDQDYLSAAGDSLKVTTSDSLPSPLSGDVTVRYTFSQLAGSNGTITNNLSTSNISVEVSGERAPAFAVSDAQIILDSNFMPALQLTISCKSSLDVEGTCAGLELSNLKTSLAIFTPGTTIDVPYLSSLTATGSTPAGSDNSQYLVVKSLEELGVSFSDLATTQFIYVLTHGSSVSFSYSLLGSS